MIFSGMPADSLWSDPARGISGKYKNLVPISAYVDLRIVAGFAANPRDVSYEFGEDMVINFCANTDIDLIVRAHRVVIGRI